MPLRLIGEDTVYIEEKRLNRPLTLEPLGDVCVIVLHAAPVRVGQGINDAVLYQLRNTVSCPINN